MIYIFSIFYILFSIFVLHLTIPIYIEIIKYRNKDEKICITILFITVIIVIITVLNLNIKGMIDLISKYII